MILHEHDSQRIVAGYARVFLPPLPRAIFPWLAAFRNSTNLPEVQVAQVRPAQVRD